MLVKNVACNGPKFKLHPTIAKQKDPMGSYLAIPPKELLINDIRSFYHCTIQELGMFEMNEA